ncbi:hypothetical protein TNCV_1881061 [Trichonephila clavipes]|nr:hypothetical protein TNCV_1881061 [Trichonephila clavipes]
MNRDDSDLSSLSDEDDYQVDNGNEMDDGDEDVDKGRHSVLYFAFRFSVTNALIYGLPKKPSPPPSLAEEENDEPPPKRRVTTTSSSS